MADGWQPEFAAYLLCLMAAGFIGTIALVWLLGWMPHQQK